jgi:hypothetical protein
MMQKLVDLGNGLYHGEQIDTLMGSKAKIVLAMKSCRNQRYIWSGKDAVFIDKSRESGRNVYWLMATEAVSIEKTEIISNLHLSGIGEEFIALQLDIEIPVVIKVLKEQGIYRGNS